MWHFIFNGDISIHHLEGHYFDGCPHAQAAIDSSEQYRTDHPDAESTLIQVDSDENAARIGFHDSPTILVDGRDLFNAPTPKYPYLACRFYLCGLPSYKAFAGC